MAEVGDVVLVGHSQTGNVTTNYILDAHDEQRCADGSPVFDGFFPSGMPIERRSAGPTCRSCSSSAKGTSAVPDYVLHPGVDGRAYRRDDSDEPGDRFRLYELAGVPHMGTRYFPYNDLSLWQSQFPGLRARE